MMPLKIFLEQDGFRYVAYRDLPEKTKQEVRRYFTPEGRVGPFRSIASWAWPVNPDGSYNRRCPFIEPFLTLNEAGIVEPLFGNRDYQEQAMQRTAKMEHQIEALSRLAAGNEADVALALDDLVHDAKSREASGINNEGVEAQITFLLESGYTFDELKQIIENPYVEDDVEGGDG